MKLKSIITLFVLTLSVTFMGGCAGKNYLPNELVELIGLPSCTKVEVSEEALIEIGRKTIKEAK